MNTQPLVSILVTCFNHQKYVDESLRSALDQNYSNLEVVVGDDGSTDNTYAIITALAERYGSRLCIVGENSHVGIAKNANRVLQKCKGKYIAFWCGDDVMLPGKITAQVTWFENNPEAVMCGHDTTYFDDSTNKPLYNYSDRTPLADGYGLDYFEKTPGMYDAISIMVKANTIPKGGFDCRVKVCSDLKMWVDILAAGGHYGFVDGVYARHRWHGRNASADSIKAAKNMREAYMAVASDHQSVRYKCEASVAGYDGRLARHYLSRKDYFRGLFYIRSLQRRGHLTNDRLLDVTQDNPRLQKVLLLARSLKQSLL